MSTPKQHIYLAEHPLTGKPVERLIRSDGRASSIESAIAADLIKVRRATPDDVARLYAAGVKVESLGSDPTPDPTLPLPGIPPTDAN